jgi:uncharacterized membrane protein
MSRWLAAALAIVSTLWVVIVLLAPFGLAAGSPLAWLVYYAASGICHQRPERSFHLAEAAMPVCARCFGLYLSGSMGALVAWLPLRRMDPSTGRTRMLLALAALPTLVTWGLERFGVVAISSAVRAVAALPLGAGAGWIMVRSLRAERRAAAAAPDAL